LRRVFGPLQYNIPHRNPLVPHTIRHTTERFVLQSIYTSHYAPVFHLLQNPLVQKQRVKQRIKAQNNAYSTTYYIVYANHQIRPGIN
jgi:hypothetical protein